MIPIYDAKLIQIDVTNACNHCCANCTRFVGHHKKPYFMSLKEVENAIKSLDGYSGGIGLMGGEPLIHPKFPEICELYRQLIPERSRRGLWTSGYKWKEYEKIIHKTFNRENVVYNPHLEKDEGWHQPLLISSEEIIEDKNLMEWLIRHCWVQERWSPSINKNGAFFCEVAGALDVLFNLGGGYKVKSGWWNKTPNEFSDQVKRYCTLCSAAIPLPAHDSREKKDLISPKNLERLIELGSPKALAGNYELYSKKYTGVDWAKYVTKWKPGHFREFVQFDPTKRYESEENGRADKNKC